MTSRVHTHTVDYMHVHVIMNPSIYMQEEATTVGPTHAILWSQLYVAN